ncbi:Os02g0254866, partial [Oryza sativa Japonica Group]
SLSPAKSGRRRHRSISSPIASLLVSLHHRLCLPPANPFFPFPPSPPPHSNHHN